MARSDPSSTPSPSTPIFVVCEICNRQFRGQMAWDRKVRHMNEDHPTPSPPRKRSRGHEQTMGVVRPTPRAPVETLELQVNSVEALLQIEDQVFALLRLNKYSQEQERANGALVQAIVTCPDPARVGSIKETLQAFEIYCFSRAVSQFPITDLKVALFLADHLGFAPSPSTLQAHASVPPVQAAALSFPPGHPVCVSVLSRWLDDLQNCCTITAFCFLPGGQVENLAAHQAVRVVMEEARRSDAQEVLDAVRKSLMDGGMKKFYRSSMPIPATNSAKLESYKNEVLKNLETNLSFLQDKRAQVRENYVAPAAAYVSDSAHSRPLITGIVGLFLALAFFPILGFILFAVSTIVVVLGGAVAFGVFWSGIAVGGAALLLAGALFVSAASALLVGFWVSVAYAFIRLFVCVIYADSVPAGVQTFEGEVRALLFPSSSAAPLENNHEATAETT